MIFYLPCVRNVLVSGKDCGILAINKDVRLLSDNHTEATHGLKVTRMSGKMSFPGPFPPAAVFLLASGLSENEGAQEIRMAGNKARFKTQRSYM